MTSALRKVRQWDAIVLTTNGAMLNNLHDHVNISRHAEGDNENRSIFLTRHFPTLDVIASQVKLLNERNIDVTINCTLQGQFDQGGLFSFLQARHLTKMPH